MSDGSTDSVETALPNTTFSRSIPPEEQNRLLTRAAEKPFDPASIPLMEGYTLHPTTETEKGILSGLLSNAQNRLSQLGFSYPEQILPQLDHIVLINRSPEEEADPESNTPGGFVERTPEHVKYLVMELTSGGLESLRDQTAFYHELGHYITTSVIVPDTESGQYLAFDGFGRFDREKPGKVALPRGLWEEGTSDMLAMFCGNSTMETPYPKQAAFMISFVNDFFHRLEITPVEAFSQIFHAKVTRDFEFQTRLTGLYGTQFVKELNNTRTFMGSITADLNPIADLGGFSNNYLENTKRLETGESISIPGFTAAIKLGAYNAENLVD